MTSGKKIISIFDCIVAMHMYTLSKAPKERVIKKVILLIFDSLLNSVPLWRVRMILVVCMLLLRNSEVCKLAFFFLSYSLMFFCFAEAAKEFKTEKKKSGIPLNSIFIFRVYDYLECGIFTWTSRNGCASRSKNLKILRNHFLQIVNLRVGMFNWLR